MREAPELKERAQELAGRVLKQVRLVTDTTEFMALEPGDVVELQGRRFVLLGTEFEGRFGLDEQPKHWVKRSRDLEDGSPRILKLVFHEEFVLPIGQFKIRCFRSPAKEARILELVRGHPHFMQGHTLYDAAGNPVRVLERIRGGPLDQLLSDMEMEHQQYYQLHLRGVLERLVPVFQALAYLHRQGERHGDVRRDHVFVDQDSGTWRWIDFDYNFDFRENPYGLDLFGLGNILAYAVARGEVTLYWIKRQRPELVDGLSADDFSPIIKNRLMNLGKFFPYLPRRLNNVLLHFSAGSRLFYQRVEELLEELGPALEDLPRPAPEEAS
ncbi:MAG: serine/threonine protein kinase [Thermodesulfobacteriota bacterium]